MSKFGLSTLRSERSKARPDAVKAGPSRTSVGPGASAPLQRTGHSPSTDPASQMLALQRMAGNRAVGRLVAETAAAAGGPRTQPKLTVGPASDSYEKEADRAASQVTGTTENATATSAGPVESSPAPVQRAAVGGGSFEAGARLEGQLAANKGGGSALSAQARSYMEPRFGADFSRVRVHTGAGAAQLNRSIQAQAFTHGNDIYFGAGKYQPGTGGGNHLLAHELTHVVQQGGVGTQARRKVDPGVAQVEGRLPAHRISTKKRKMHLDFVKIKRADPDWKKMLSKIFKGKPPAEDSKKGRKAKGKGQNAPTTEAEGGEQDPIGQIMFGGQARGVQDTWGHWWTEIGDLFPTNFNVEESYGWWPNAQIGNNMWKLMTGVSGALNGGDGTKHDEHEGHAAATQFHPVKKVDPDNKSYDEIRDEVTNDIRNFATGYKGKWNWFLGWGKNCQTFQKDLMKKAKLHHQTSKHWLKKPVVTEEEKKDLEDQAARDAGAFGFMTVPEGVYLGSVNETGKNTGAVRSGEKIGITGKTMDIDFHGRAFPHVQYWYLGSLRWVDAAEFPMQMNRPYPMSLEELQEQEKPKEENKQTDDSLILQL